MSDKPIGATYQFYTDTMRRSVIPDERTFYQYADSEELAVRNLVSDGILEERFDGALAELICRLCEIDYTTEQAMQGATEGQLVSESIGSYSYTRNTKAQESAIQANARSRVRQKYDMIRLYCHMHTGVI